MKSTLNNRLLQHLLKKKEDGGFTLIELLVVIIIIGILAAIALPAFLNQANRARQSEATTYVGSVNRGQQAYRLEKKNFADEVGKLGLGINTNTEFYYYGKKDKTPNELEDITSSSKPTGTNGAIWATSDDPALLQYAGLTYTLQDVGGNVTTSAVLCTADDPNVAVNMDNTGGAFSTDIPVITSDNGNCGEDN